MIGVIQIIPFKSFTSEISAHQTHHKMTSKKTACVSEVVPCFSFCSLVEQYGYRSHGKKNAHVNWKFGKSPLSVPNIPFLIFIFSHLLEKE